MYWLLWEWGSRRQAIASFSRLPGESQMRPNTWEGRRMEGLGSNLEHDFFAISFFIVSHLEWFELCLKVQTGWCRGISGQAREGRGSYAAMTDNRLVKL